MSALSRGGDGAVACVRAELSDRHQATTVGAIWPGLSMIFETPGWPLPFTPADGTRKPEEKGRSEVTVRPRFGGNAVSAGRRLAKPGWAVMS
jgi:hypothetical protein